MYLGWSQRTASVNRLLLKGPEFKYDVCRYFCRTCRHPVRSRNMIIVVQMLTGCLYRSSSTDVCFTPCWVAPHCFISFHVAAPIWRLSQSSYQELIHSGKTKWWRIKQPAAPSRVLWFHICVASSWERTKLKLKYIYKWLRGGWLCGVEALPELCVLQSAALGVSSGWPR